MQKVIQNAIYGMLAVFMALFIGSSLFLRAEYNYAVYSDKPVLQQQHLLILLLLVIGLIVVSLVLYRLCQQLNRYRPRIVIPIVLGISLAIQLGIILLLPRLPTDDSQTVVSLALRMLNDGDYSTFQSGGYLYMFPFNFSTVLYIKALLWIFPDNYLVLKIFNILFTLVTMLMIYLIYKQLNYRSTGRDYGVLVFAATYMPALLMSNFIYNDVIATTLLTASLYTVIRFVKTRSIRYIVLAAILLALGNYFRSIGIIFLIASVIYLLLYSRSIGWKKMLISLGIMAILFNVPGWTQNAALQASGVVDEPTSTNAAPVYMWLNMGMNQSTFGFWDNMLSYNIYQREAEYNKAKSIPLFQQAIEDKLSSMSPGELAELYYKKLIWTWTEGTYQIERYGIGTERSAGGGMGFVMGGYSYSTVATQLFAGDSVYRSGLMWVLYAMNFLMYIFVLVRLIGAIRRRRYDEAALVLIILGFIGFYLLWEIKSRYIYPVYPLLIILSYMGFKDVYDGLSRYMPFRRKGD
ncbi:glycosyltransferase family 39 protein [Paenibacillus wulumuqiensis]|uniref:glycosyltransferase family 39 protein n=1 Tax=Paenibacillus wulumuqiensis TaxID=1567107 RepID=UPI00061953E2|nr:glycosyltransferase family 39 protein [Paenibacillus wulumuqiensis]